jgi:predicted membrane-bound mannosyltransferase
MGRGIYMHNSAKNDVVLVIGMSVCVGLWWLAGDACDGTYIYDSAVWLSVLLVSLVALLIPRVRPAWRTTVADDTQLAIVGALVLTIVFVRQWVQLAHLNEDITEAFYNNDTSLFRYATTQLVMWVCGWSYLLVATIPAWSLPTLARQYWREWSIVTALIVVAGVLRLVDLGIVPHIINGDEGLIGTWASQVMKQIGTLGLVFANMDGVATNYLYVMSGLFQLFGQNALTVRLIPAVFGVLAVGTNYLFTRALFGQRTATIMAVLLTFAHVHVHFSRTVAVVIRLCDCAGAVGIVGYLAGGADAPILAGGHSRPGVGATCQFVCRWLGMVGIGAVDYRGMVDC